MSGRILTAAFSLLIMMFFIACNQQPGKDSAEDTREISDYNKPELVATPATKAANDSAVSQEIVSKVEPEPGSGPDPAELDKRRQIKSIFDEGVRKLKRNEYLAAIQEFDRLLQIDPDNSRAYYNRGFAYYYLDMHSEAEADFDRSIELNPDDSSSFLYKGMIRYFNDDFEGSIEEYNKSLERGPHYYKAYYNRGLAKGQLKDLQGAIKDFNKALTIEPNNKESYYNRALAYFMLGDTSRACTDWKKAKELGSANAAEAIRYYCEDK